MPSSTVPRPGLNRDDRVVQRPDPILQPTSSATTLPASPSPIGPELAVSDLHNVHELTPRIYCGSGPETDADFAALAKLGIKTVLTVDGMRPNVAAAERHGLRYVHIPFGYDGVPRDKELAIGRAVRDLPGPFYIHCHHGQHRGPTGAVIAAMTVDGWSPDRAIATLRAMGTSPHYKGLYECAREFQKPTPQELDHADSSFPPVAKLDELSDVMVQIDHRWDHLKAARKAGWAAPKENPDIDPPHEATILRELFREARRPGGPASNRPEDLRRGLELMENHAEALEDALRRGDRSAASLAADAVSNACAACHDRYRDEPGKGVRK